MKTNLNDWSFKQKLSDYLQKCPRCEALAVEIKRSELNCKNRTDYVIKLACGHSIIIDGVERQDFTKILSSDGKKLFHYQIDGCKFIEKARYSAGIFDEQGLGKTMQAIAPIKDNPDLWPYIILCKSGLKIQFFKELIRWLGPEYWPQIIQKPTDILLKTKGYIFSHDILRNFSQEKLESLNPSYIIIDECQAFKNPDSQRTKKMREWIRTIPYKVATSGTPIKNRPSEYYTILNILNPLKFPSENIFKAMYIKYQIDSNGALKEVGLRNEEKFNEETNDFIIRRERKEIFKELPTINRQFFNIDLEETASKAYSEQESELAQLIDEYEISDDSQEYANILAKINRLRQIVGISKVKYCADFVSEMLLTTSKKVTIYVHHKVTGNFLNELLKKCCEDMGIDAPLRIQGGDSPEKRDDVQDKFAMKDRHRILIASTLAAGVGMNLQYQCFTCILLERQWNPTDEEQAETRFTRPESPKMKGQVDSIYMIAPNTIDEYLTQIVEQKRQMFEEVMNNRKILWNENELMRGLFKAIQVKNAKGGVSF